MLDYDHGWLYVCEMHSERWLLYACDSTAMISTFASACFWIDWRCIEWCGGLRLINIAP